MNPRKLNFYSAIKKAAQRQLFQLLQNSGENQPPIIAILAITAKAALYAVRSHWGAALGARCLIQGRLHVSVWGMVLITWPSCGISSPTYYDQYLATKSKSQAQKGSLVY